MRGSEDWSWKLQEAIERIKTRYEFIGRKTGAPFLAIIYPPEVEIKVLKEWRTLAKTLSRDFDVKTIDVMAVTMSIIKEIQIENILSSIKDPMPGSNPESELGHMWVTAITNAVREKCFEAGNGQESDCFRKSRIALSSHGSSCSNAEFMG